MKEDYQQQPQKQTEITLGQLQQYHNQLNDLYEQNINLRMKYPTEPMKFYQSQEEIDNILQSLQVLAQEHIPIIIESNLLTAILKLLNHPNQDINISCIEFLHELISEQPQKDQIFEVYYRMCVWLVDNGIYDSLVQTLNKMNEEDSVEQYEVSLQILKIVQTLTDQVQTSIDGIVNQTKMLEYLSNRIMPNYLVKHKVIDDNKFVGSDLLALLLSHSHQAQVKFHTLCGMQILLESIRQYLSRVAGSSDEQQYLGNLFDCVNILLINPSEQLLKSKIIYHQMKGNEIMLQFLKSKTDSSPSALKAISNSFINVNSINPEMEMHIIEELIDFGALKYIFPIIMRQGIRGKDVDQQMVIDENCLKIILIMISSTSQIYRMRVQAKLTEKRYAKLEKLFEIRNQYMQIIGKEALKVSNAQEYFSKMKEGLGVVEIIDRMLCTLAVSDSTVRQKLVVLMKLYGVMADDIQFILKTKYAFISQGTEKDSLEHLLSEYLPILHQLMTAQKSEPQE